MGVLEIIALVRQISALLGDAKLKKLIADIRAKDWQAALADILALIAAQQTGTVMGCTPLTAATLADLDALEAECRAA